MIDNTFVKLHKMSDEFHLTGSRFFGTNHVNSDWDFMVKDTPYIGQKLTEIGFVHVPNDYLDPLTVGLYGHTKDNIHVQTVTNIRLKLMAQEYIKNHNWLRNKNKAQQKIVWQITLEIFEDIEKGFIGPGCKWSLSTPHI